MTVEEALVALLTLVAVALLFVGLAQALGAPRPERRRPGPRPRPEAARRHTAESALQRRARGSRVPLPSQRQGGAEPTAAPAAAAPPEPALPPPPSMEDRPEPPPEAVQLSLSEAPPLAARAADSLEFCLRVYQEGEYAQALEAADSALRAAAGESAEPGVAGERAALWGLAGLARQALGEPAAARQAFEAGLACSPGAEGSPASPRAMLLAGLVARQIVAGAEATPEAAADALAGLRLARALAEAATAADPSDDESRALSARAGTLGWALLERRAEALLGRREFEEAHRLIEEVLRCPNLPPDRREALCELLWTSVTGEVGRLTGQALESTGDVSAALALLDRAAETVRCVSEGVVTPERAEDLQRRLWWGHTKLGVERIESGDPEAALPPLYRALGLPDVDPERQMQTRRALARALEAAAHRAQEAVEGLLGAGDGPGAEARGQALCRAIDEALERGLSQEDLLDAIAKRQHVMALIAGTEGG